MTGPTCPCSIFACSGEVVRNHYEVSVGQVSVPEPGTLGMFAIGLVGLGVFRRRRQV